MAKKFLKILLYINLFLIRFVTIKIYKSIIGIYLVTRILNVLIYIIVNLYIIFKLIITSNHLNYILNIYIIIYKNNIHFIFMFVHFKLLKLITRFI